MQHQLKMMHHYHFLSALRLGFVDFNTTILMIFQLRNDFAESPSLITSKLTCENTNHFPNSLAFTTQEEVFPLIKLEKRLIIGDITSQLIERYNKCQLQNLVPFALSKLSRRGFMKKVNAQTCKTKSCNQNTLFQMK